MSDAPFKSEAMADYCFDCMAVVQTNDDDHGSRCEHCGKQTLTIMLWEPRLAHRYDVHTHLLWLAEQVAITDGHDMSPGERLTWLQEQARAALDEAKAD